MPDTLETPISSKFKLERSKQLSKQIAEVIPGGVDSPFRSFEEVGGHTIFFERAQGSKLFDVDGNAYIDYLGAWGPAVLGHAPAQVVQACKKVIELGPVFGAPHELEISLASKIIEKVSSIEQIRFVNSGTEAVMSAVRLARGFTGRDLIIMFEGCYHGHSDVVLASNLHKSSGGVPSKVAENTLLIPFNDSDALSKCLQAYKNKIAAVIIEPVAGSMGVILPKENYLAEVRALCSQHNCLLIFDEVLTGFRVALGGAQELYGIKPDLTCFGKILGGGMPIGAYGGTKEIMQHLLPVGDVYQAGTFSGNPVSMAGGVATINALSQPGVYETLERRSNQLFDGLNKVIESLGLDIQLQRVGSMFAILFAPHPVLNFKDSEEINSRQYSRFFHKLLELGVYMPPSSVDAACLSYAHTEDDIQQTIEAMILALQEH